MDAVARIDPHITKLVRKASETSKSPAGRDAQFAHSSDWHRSYDGEGFKINDMFASDDCGAHNGHLYLDYNDQRVLDVDRVEGNVRVYVPGRWEQDLHILHGRLSA